MLRTLASTLVALYAVSALAACPSAGPAPVPDEPAPTAHFAKPKAFLLNLVAIAKAGDQAAWTVQLSAAQRTRAEHPPVREGMTAPADSPAEGLAGYC